MFNPSVVFLAFANDNSSYLPSLKEESEKVYNTLLPVEENQKSIVIRREESAENNDIDFYLGRYKDRLAIFHYAGHADSTVLSFEDKHGNTEGLANLLGLQKHLKLVFLNACSTKEQAYLYIKSGVKAVIATSLPVKDAHAKIFSEAFYNALANNHTIEEAYLTGIGVLKQNFAQYGEHKNAIVFYDNVFGEKEKSAKIIENEEKDNSVEETIETKNNVNYITRKLVRRGHQPDDKEIPWRLYVNADHSDVIQWKITEPPIKEYLLEGTSQYFNRLRKSRFEYVDFDKTLLWYNHTRSIIEGQISDLVDSFLERPAKNAIIFGKGGTGKTTNTVRLWHHFLRKSKNWSKPIPLYISLSDYNHGEFERNFIMYEIGEHYLGKEKLNDDAFNQLYDIFRIPIVDELGDKHPNFILFLDGLDEVIIEHGQLLDEIEEFANDAAGVQVIITNSEPLPHTWAKDFNLIELASRRVDFGDEILTSSSFTNNSLEMLMENPMMSEIYREGEEVVIRHLENEHLKFLLPVTTRGELLWNHFEVLLAKQYENFMKDRYEPFFYYRFKFMMRHFMPFLAHLMEKQGVLYFNEEQLQSAIDHICDKLYNRHFLRTYKEYRRDFSYFNLAADSWVKEEERFGILSEYLINEYPMFIQEEDKYEFSHQLYRDYLAAVHIRNDINLSLKKYLLPSSLSERKLSSKNQLFLLLGELEGEHYHQGIEGNTFTEESTLLEQTLERCRNVYDKKIIGFTVWNILNIWKELRGELSGLDLSALDLRGFSLNGVKLQQSDHTQSHSVNLRNTLIDRNVFLAGSEKGQVLHARFSNLLKFPDSYVGYDNETMQLFATASADGTVKLWDIASRRCFNIFDEAKEEVTAVEFSPNGKYVYGASKDGFLRIWDIEKGELIFEVLAHPAPLKSVRVSPDGDFLATCSEDSTIKIWHKKRYNHFSEHVTLEGHSKTVECLTFSHDGQYLVSGGWDRKVILWDWQGEKAIWVKDNHVSVVNDVEFSPDDKYILSGSSDDTILEWEVSTGNLHQKYYEHHQGVNSVAYSPNGKSIASGSSDENIVIWDRKTGKTSFKLKDHNYYVLSVMFSPDGKYLLSGSADGTIKLWDIATGECSHTFSNYNGLHVQGVDFRRLHKDSHLQVTDKKVLRQFGGIFNDEDESVWLDLTDRLCYLFDEGY